MSGRPPFKVKAVYEYKSNEPDDLTFPNGQIITVTEAEEDDWYTGEYVNASGKSVEGIFPRNFVEKYEPAIPTRPARTKRAPAPEVQHHEPTPSSPLHESAPEPVREAEIELPKPAPEPDYEPPATASPPSAQALATTARSPPSIPKSASSKPAPPVAEKPSGNSFRDRIAAFNKPAAAPIAPFKAGGQAGSSGGFIRKPFVAPPPSKNAYVPPPREQPPQKIYRREEETEPEHDPPLETPAQDSSQEPHEEAASENVQKPTSLKDRIALLQKQQLEQAARQSDPAQKKEKPRKPQRVQTNSAEEVERVVALSEEPLTRVDTNETVGKKSVDFADDEAGPLRGPRRQASEHASIRTPPQPSRELMSDTNDADESGAGDTEDALETSTEGEVSDARRAPALGEIDGEVSRGGPAAEPVDEGANEQEGEEEEDEDPEFRRRREIRDRMAKMSGGMGMMGMFGPPGGIAGSAPPRKPKTLTESERLVSTQQEQEELMSRAPPVPIMAMPGMSNMRAAKADSPVETESEEEDTAQHTPEPPAAKSLEKEPVPQLPKRSSTDRAFLPAPQERAVPPLPSRDPRTAPPPPSSERPVLGAPQASQTRSVPPLPPIVPQSTTPGDESADELPLEEADPRASRRDWRDAQPVPAAPPVPASKPQPESAQVTSSPPSSPITADKRSNRAPPPLPPMSPTGPSPQTRAPPPPPPGQPPSRRSTSDSYSSMKASKHQVDHDSEDEVTEYDGDYDTDIASGAKHKDALKSHNRDLSLDDGLLGDETTLKSPPARAVPPLPTFSVPRDLPPPPPQQTPKSRKSMDTPRVAPPPVPAARDTYDEPNNDYDPYRFSAPAPTLSSPATRLPYSSGLTSPKEELDEDEMYEARAHATRAPLSPSSDRIGPALLPMTPAPASMPDPPRQSLDIKRSSTQARRSMEQSRPSGEHGFIATDIDLGQSSQWWMKANMPPPSLQNRTDVLYETESSTSTKRGGKTTISKDVYVLYIDYSQTIINAIFDVSEPSHVTLEQRHERPPPPVRQDQLEAASHQFGSRIAENAARLVNSSVSDSSAHLFVFELIRSTPDALLPVGIRAYGALVYANLANASTQQFDEIRPGDIVTFRNAKFAGHKGGLHTKYSLDVGKPDHVGVVIDWDGTKKKIRAWEQGREDKGKKGKVREESFRVGDLKSGEVRVWRVMGRKWVGWDSGSGNQ